MHVTVTLRPSIRQVAERAGVSRMTVSRVLNDRTQQVSEETRERVMNAVRELEYVPVSQPTIQSRHAETRILGLIFDGALIDDVWGLPTFLGLKEAASTRDYDLLTLLRSRPNWMIDQEELQFLDRRNDGCIFIRPENRYEIIQTLVAHRLPVVACYTTDVPPEVPTIVLDNEGAMEQVVHYLIEQGHRRILHLNNLQHRSDFRERRLGFEQAIRKYDMEPIVLNVDDVFAEDAAANLLAAVNHHDITAIACASDYLASFAWDAAELHGLEIPRDLSITGMDNLVEPAKRGLTSIHFSCEEVGRQAIESIVGLIHGDVKRAKCTVIPVHLIHRSSVAPPRPFTSAVETGRVLHHMVSA